MPLPEPLGKYDSHIPGPQSRSSRAHITRDLPIPGGSNVYTDSSVSSAADANEDSLGLVKQSLTQETIASTDRGLRSAPTNHNEIHTKNKDLPWPHPLPKADCVCAGVLGGTASTDGEPGSEAGSVL
jgi:hypothetical protein